MRRKAGQKIAGEVGKNAIEGDALTKVIIAGATAGLGATQLMGLIDLFTGEAQLANSGEMSANLAINLVPLATAAAGAAVGSDPVSRGLLGAYAQDVHFKNTVRTATQDADINDARQNLYGAADNLKARIMEEASKQHSDPRAVVRQSGRKVARGAGIGAMAGVIPTLMLMRDAPAQQQEVI